MKIEIDIHSDFADTVAAHSIAESYDYLLSCLDGTHAIYSYNAEEEKAYINKYLKAFEIVMEWYDVEIPSSGTVEKEKDNGNERRIPRRNEST
jgi:hypothetical protein